MGLATIINMIVYVCVPSWGTWTIYLVSVPVNYPIHFNCLTLTGLGFMVAGFAHGHIYMLLYPLGFVSRSTGQ